MFLQAQTRSQVSSLITTAQPAVPPAYILRFPETDFGHAQDEEWCEVYLDNEWQRFRLHDYGFIYDKPGLYEYLFYHTLQCCSPVQVVKLLAEMLEDAGQSPRTLRVLDVGAGNGMVGEVLRSLGIAYLGGVDIEPMAKIATERDRPDLYDLYNVVDLCNVPEPIEAHLRAARFNSMVTVAALGFGDIPPEAFRRAFDVVDTPGWIALNIKETFFTRSDDSGFFRLLRTLWDQGIIEVQSFRRYCHRLSIAGKPLYYVAVVAKKVQEIPDSLMNKIQTG